MTTQSINELPLSDLRAGPSNAGRLADLVIRPVGRHARPVASAGFPSADA